MADVVVPSRQEAFRFALDPTPEQERKLLSHAGAARFAYNWGVAVIGEARQAYAEAKKAGLPKEQLPAVPGHFELCKMWTAYKNAHDGRDGRPGTLAWVGENFSGTYQAALRDAAQAWKNFQDSKSGRRKGRAVGRPNFKSKRKNAPAFQAHGDTVRLESQTRLIRKWKSWAKRKNKWQTLNGPGLVLPVIGRITIMSDHDRRWQAGHADNIKADLNERNRRRARRLLRLLRTGQARIARVNITREPDGIWFASCTVELMTTAARELATQWAAFSEQRGTPLPAEVVDDLAWRLAPALDEHSVKEVWAAMVRLHPGTPAPALDLKGLPKALTKDLAQARKDNPELAKEIPGNHRPPTRRQRQGGTVGVDLGVRYLATLSTGEKWENPRLYERALAQLRAAQRALSRAQDGSKRQERARRRVALLHARVRRARRGVITRAVTKIVRRHERVVVEGWNVQAAMQHGTPPEDVPKRIRKARNQALADAARGDFRGRLQLAAPKAGSTVTVLDPHAPTGRTCSRCGEVRAKPLPPHEETFACPACGYTGDRRHNTARALLRLAASQAGSSGPESRREGVRPSTPRGGGRPSMKRAARARLGRGKTGTPDP